MPKRWFARIPAGLRLGLCLLPVACAPSDFTAIGPVRQADRYAALHPYYVELCAVSGVAKRPGFGAEIAGGPGGHSVLYLNGVCRAPEARYPTVRVCGDPAHGAEAGVGISANAHFANANWIATDGPDFFFQGMLRPGQTLDQASYRETQARAERLGLLNGVRFHDTVFADQPRNMSRTDFMYEMSVSTDYAIAFGRGRYCARVPVDQAQMRAVTAELNARNQRYRTGAPYEWNVLRNNCAHLTHNAVAAAGLWPACPVDENPILAAFDFPVPKNDFVALLHRRNDAALSDLAALFRDEQARAVVMRWNHLPAEPGALAGSAPVWPDNALYRRDTRLIFYPDPLFDRFQAWFDQIGREPRLRDPVANLRYFQNLYAALERNWRPLAWWLAAHPDLARAPGGFAAFHARFHAILARQRLETDRALLMIDGDRFGPRPNVGS